MPRLLPKDRLQRRPGTGSEFLAGSGDAGGLGYMPCRELESWKECYGGQAPELQDVVLFELGCPVPPGALAKLTACCLLE